MILRIQSGIEVVNKQGKRTVRLTPFDKQYRVPDDLGMIILSLGQLADASDKHAGDGEVDIPVKQFPKLPGKISALLENLAAADSNAFIRISQN
jgi:hypothetical protein